MELLCNFKRGFTPGLLEKLVGLKAEDEVLGTELFLTDSNSRRLLPAKDLARVFCLIIQRITVSNAIQLLFTHDLKEVSKKLNRLQFTLREEKGRLWVNFNQETSSQLALILEIFSFVTFYGSNMEISLDKVNGKFGNHTLNFRLKRRKDES